MKNYIGGKGGGALLMCTKGTNAPVLLPIIVIGGVSPAHYISFQQNTLLTYLWKTRL